jgi:hypothetical protein
LLTVALAIITKQVCIKAAQKPIQDMTKQKKISGNVRSAIIISLH